MSRAQQISRPVRDLVKARSGGVCEVCGVAAAVHMHHRRPRGMGGSRAPSTNTASNLLHLCLACHTAIESASRTRATSYGWLVPAAVDDPGMVPALLASPYGQQYTYLHADGTSDYTDLATDLARAFLELRTRHHEGEEAL